MGKCFVMQPFDGGTFDKRYDDVYAPAIEDAGLEPYRVDRDHSVSIPIDDIESGIKNSELCLAEITTDNPNVWFELGYAIAIPKEVILVCSDERTSKFPFDVQHRNIIKYKTESSQDYTQLRDKIKQRILAILKKQREISKVSKLSPVADTEGPSQHELVALNIQKNAQYEKPFYWIIENNKKDGPFCQQCYDNERKLIRPLDHNNGVWTCPTCKNIYKDSSYRDPRPDGNSEWDAFT